jgi:hypothetical protein
MAEGIDAASFEFYEGIRILIPGAITLGLAEGVTRTLSADGDGLGLGTFASFVVALLVGLIFYFVDAPAKAAVVRPLRPTDTLFSWKVRPRSGTTTVNNYFVMLDEDIPGPIRARALYMGSMYRIGFEAVYLLALVSAAVLSLSTCTMRHPHIDAHREPRELSLAAACLVLIWLYSVYLDRDERRKEKKATDVRSKHFSRADTLAAVLIVAVLVGLYVAHDEIASWVLTLPSAALFALWAVRYFRGYTDKSGTNTVTRPIAATHACLLLLVAQLSVVATLVILPYVDTDLSRNELRVWLVCALGAMVLVCGRGHEKRLRGAYATQNTWLMLHKSEIIAAYFTEAVAEEPPAPARRGLVARMRRQGS